LYWQIAVTGQSFNAPADVSLPMAVTVFPEELRPGAAQLDRKAYHNLIYFHGAEMGGHFAAWERRSAHCVEGSAMPETVGLSRGARRAA
jgi:hypothetical protein